MAADGNIEVKGKVNVHLMWTLTYAIIGPVIGFHAKCMPQYG